MLLGYKKTHPRIIIKNYYNIDVKNIQFLFTKSRIERKPWI